MALTVQFKSAQNVRYVTIWKRKNLDGKFVTHHVSEGWSTAGQPYPENPAQERAWPSSEWKRVWGKIVDGQVREV